MSHPTQFRVWSKLEGKWMDNIVISAAGTPILLYSEKVDKRVFHRVYLIDNYQPVVQWSTGLKDKTGATIYEGDIFRFDGADHEYEVRYIEGGFRFGGVATLGFLGSLKGYPVGRDETLEVIDTSLERAARATQAAESTDQKEKDIV